MWILLEDFILRNIVHVARTTLTLLAVKFDISPQPEVTHEEMQGFFFFKYYAQDFLQTSDAHLQDTCNGWLL